MDTALPASVAAPGLATDDPADRIGAAAVQAVVDLCALVDQLRAEVLDLMIEVTRAREALSLARREVDVGYERGRADGWSEAAETALSWVRPWPEAVTMLQPLRGGPPA